MSDEAVRSRTWSVALLVAALLFVWCIALIAGKSQLDLDVYRSGGRAVLGGHDLYQFRIRQYGFTYPPFAGLLFVGLSALPHGAAMVAMAVVSLACLTVFVALSAPGLLARVFVRPSAGSIAGLAALLLCLPVRSNIWNGQVNLLLGALVAYDLLVLRRGVLVGLAAAIKLTPAIFVLYLLACGRRREAVQASLTFVVVGALTLAVLPADSLKYWGRNLFTGAGIGNVARSNNQSVRGLAERMFGHTAGIWTWAALIAPTLAIGLLVGRRVANSGREAFALGIVGVTGCLISPVSWTHHWIWCIPLLVGLWHAAARHGRTARVGVLALGVVFVVPSFLPGGALATRQEPWHTIGSGFVVAVLLTAVAVLVGRRVSERRRRCLHSPGVSAKPDLALG